MSWDKEVASKFRALGLNQEQIGMVIGEIAEHRQHADRQGYERGFESGVTLHLNNFIRPEKRSD